MKPLIIANWKANKTIKQAEEWLSKTKNKLNGLDKVQVVLCGSFITLPSLSQSLAGSNIKVGAQNVSHLGPGAFTGEVTAEMLSEIVEYCLVGHSERKKYFDESDEMVIKKVDLLLANGITPLLCVADLEQLDLYLSKSAQIKDQASKIIFIYEPPRAISGGADYHPETPQVAQQNCSAFREKVGQEITTIYGGSTNPDNIRSFLSQPNIHGVLPGQASLDPDTFVDLVSVASEAVI